jgi:hypothetical protein
LDESLGILFPSAVLVFAISACRFPCCCIDPLFNPYLIFGGHQAYGRTSFFGSAGLPEWMFGGQVLVACFIFLERTPPACPAWSIVGPQELIR